jgi:hypothetical protein
LLAQDGEAGLPPLAQSFQTVFRLKVNLIVNVTLFLDGGTGNVQAKTSTREIDTAALMP